MILISTDWVFDGTQGPADETTPPNPINYYGVLKVVSENLLPVMTRNWAVARVAGVNGLHQTRPEKQFEQDPGFGNLMMAVVERLRQGLPFIVWDGNVNQVATPGLATEIGEMVMRIIEKDLCGVFHCCGGEGISRLELANATAEGFGLDRALIRQELVQTGPNHISIPRDTRLDASETASRLGIPLLSVREMVRELRKQVDTSENGEWAPGPLSRSKYGSGNHTVRARDRLV